METYRGIKFCTRRESCTFATEGPLEELNHWVYILAELGLAPVHRQGAFGNHSFVEEDGSFVITRTGMIPEEKLERSNYCRVKYAAEEDLFLVNGRHNPSSECFLHHMLYQGFSSVGAIMHGHSSLLIRYAEVLDIPVTSREYPYGTRELGNAAVEMVEHGISFFILRNHGFVSVDQTLRATVSRVINCYRRLINTLAEDIAKGI